MVAPGRMVTSSRRIGRVTNKTRLLIYRGSDKVDPSAAETVLWDQDNSAGADNKHQHIGATGVESGELLEHHLQAALSSASLQASSTKTAKQTTKQETPAAALNYHIPTPDATGLVADSQFAKLYQTTKYVEPYNYIRFSDTVDESCCGWGGLGYCMDDVDVKWLNDFGAKAEGPSVDVKGDKEQGRGLRVKGKEKEKGDAATLAISEDMFEYIMGVLEKYAEENAPMLHTDLSLLPLFSAVEPYFSSPISPSFLPSNEIPKELGDLKVLTRAARNVYSHWKSRREQRQGKPIVPPLNYDETNDNDPYVCFRRRDIRATRKTRRTDNFSIEQFQKLQSELRDAYSLAQSVLRRETEKRTLYQSSREEWEAKWKLFETKRRWPSLGITQQEEEMITGRPIPGLSSVQIPTIGGAPAIASAQSSTQSSQIRKRLDRDREERVQRDKYEQQRQAERTNVLSGRSNAPDALKERLSALQQKLESMIKRKKEQDSHWDDCTDNSYQPLPPSHASHAYRSIFGLDPSRSNVKDNSDQGELIHPESFRIRRGRGGVVRLDRRTSLHAHRRGSPPSSASDYPTWLFPDTAPTQNERKRPRSIDDVEPAVDKRRDVNGIWRYDSAKGGAVGVGMGLVDDQDRVIIDDLDSKYIRYRIGLLRDGDIESLKPDHYFLDQAANSLKEMAETKPPQAPIFQKPPVPQPNPQLLAAHMQQQQMLAQQQQMEQFQRFQLMAQQQAQQQALAQQQQAMQTQAQQGIPQQNGVNSPLPNGQQIQHSSHPQHHPQPQAPQQQQQQQQQMLPPNGMGVKQLKLPPHAAARLGAAMAGANGHHQQGQQGHGPQAQPTQ